VTAKKVIQKQETQYKTECNCYNQCTVHHITHIRGIHTGMHFLSNGPQNWLKEEVAGKSHTQEKTSFPADFPSNLSVEWLPPVLGALGDLIQQTGVGEWREKTLGSSVSLHQQGG
jgi:hypothetical protein